MRPACSSVWLIPASPGSIFRSLQKRSRMSPIISIASFRPSAERAIPQWSSITSPSSRWKAVCGVWPPISSSDWILRADVALGLVERLVIGADVLVDAWRASW